MAGSQDMIIIVIMMMMMSSVFAVLAGGAYFFTLPQEGDECKGTSVGGNYVIDEDGDCVLDYCDSGYTQSGGGCVVVVPDGDEDESGSGSGSGDGGGGGNYVYEFIIKEEAVHTDRWNVHITDIEADGLRVTSDQIEIHEEPEWAKCNSKEGGYECDGDVYGMIDPEPITPTDYKDLTWSAWAEGQAKVGTKLLTITMPYKVGVFKFDYFRPKLVPGWTIKENGVEVLTTTKGANEDTPQPAVVEYEIP
jgi:hypothetical protein